MILMGGRCPGGSERTASLNRLEVSYRRQISSRESSVPGRKKTVKTTAGAAHEAVASLKYPATRKNIPPAGLEAQGFVREEAPIYFRHDPHLPPVLRSSPDPAKTDRLQELLATARQRALSGEEAGILAEALERYEPWLEWSGKRERPWFEVDPVALHMHERVAAEAILRVLAREDVHRDLFADPQQDYAKAVQFYRHDIDWTNRMILGDSLQVMGSLARREDLAGKVQMIYVDPPYGIRFASNFQPQLGQRDVRDREQDLTREAGDGQGLSGHLDARHPLVPRLSARPAGDGERASRRYRQHLRADQRREPASCPVCDG